MNASSRFNAFFLSINELGEPLASTLPSCINDIRSQRSPSFIKCVDMNIVTLSFLESSIRISQKLSLAIGSTPEVGSSKINISGSWITATASESLCLIPSGSFSGSSFSTSSSPNRLIVSDVRAEIEFFGRLKRRACSSRFCLTVSSL